MNLTLFFNTGATLHFRGVSNLTIDKASNEMSFDYYGQSTKKDRKANFDMEKVSGYATDENLEAKTIN